MPNSAWTETGASISLVPVTSTIDPGSNASNVNYLTNSYKIALIAQWTAEVAMKTSLDTLASTWSVSSTSYDNAVNAISTALINAGAPSNWPLAWPDGTTSGPWLGVQTTLSANWATIATQRTALQGAISAAQAAAAQSAATTAAILAAQPHAVAWAYASKPTLPSASYPAGYYAITTDSRTIQVNAAGTAWVDVLVATTGLFGQITVGQITTGAAIADIARVGSLTAGYIYFTDGFCLNTLEPEESGANVTSAHILTSTVSISSNVSIGTSYTASGLAWSLNAASTADVYNIDAVLDLGGSSTVIVALCVDGNTASPAFLFAIYPAGTAGVGQPFFGTITGLSAGAHTLQIYLKSPSAVTLDAMLGSPQVIGTYARCQRIF